MYGYLMVDYRPRVADAELAELMQGVGAVLIEGPKACGKTSTALRVAATVFDIDQDGTDLQSSRRARAVAATR